MFFCAGRCVLRRAKLFHVEQWRPNGTGLARGAASLLRSASWNCRQLWCFLYLAANADPPIFPRGMRGGIWIGDGGFLVAAHSSRSSREEMGYSGIRGNRSTGFNAWATCHKTEFYVRLQIFRGSCSVPEGQVPGAPIAVRSNYVSEATRQIDPPVSVEVCRISLHSARISGLTC